jgi:P-type Cu+ transporter
VAEYVRLPIEGMTCTSCASRVTRAVRRIEGVESVKVNLASDSAAVAFDPSRTSLAAIADAVRRAGYEPQVERVEAFIPSARRGFLSRIGLSR